MKYLLPALVLFACLPALALGEAKRVTVGPNVVLEIEGKNRRVIVQTKVVLRKGPLEGLLTRAKKKEHEYILAGDFDARHLHTALIGAGGKPGAPVSFEPKFKPPSGTKVQIQLRYKKGDKTITDSARDWIKHHKTGKPLDTDWVFGGSRLIPNPEGKGPDYYLANHGDIVCLVNMDSAMLDLPSMSPKAFEDRIYEPNPDKVPPEGTAVEIIFEILTEK